MPATLYTILHEPLGSMAPKTQVALAQNNAQKKTHHTLGVDTGFNSNPQTI